MMEVSRPDEDLMWQYFSSARRIAWKTGTSFGNRDAWAIGVTPGYVVAVWVGNASGEGRPGLTGISAAAPVMFDIFSSLPATGWFAEPSGEMVSIPVCRYSGYRATPLCEFVDTIRVQKQGLRTGACPYHQLIHLDKSGKYQVNSSCESPSEMIHVPWFVLPPVMEWYFRTRNPFYRILPPFKAGCTPGSMNRSMDMIYPKDNSRMYIPVDLGGKPGSTIFKAAHRNPGAVVYWYLDDRFLGMTVSTHQMALSPDAGIHTLTLVDQQEERVVVHFEILRK
jgi:penicillin-binding protein 1C